MIKVTTHVHGLCDIPEHYVISKNQVTPKIVELELDISVSELMCLNACTYVQYDFGGYQYMFTRISKNVGMSKQHVMLHTPKPKSVLHRELTDFYKDYPGGVQQAITESLLGVHK